MVFIHGPPVTYKDMSADSVRAIIAMLFTSLVLMENISSGMKLIVLL